MKKEIDRKLLAALRAHEPQGLEEAIGRYSPYVAGVLRKVLGQLGTQEDLEELSSDVFVALWQSAEGLREDSDLKLWLGVVARNRALKHLRALRLELARVKEELVDCARRLKELMPSHKVRCRTTWAGVDGWQWDRFQYQTWAELEGAGEQDGPTELDRMRLAVRLARERAVTDKQGEYLAQVEGGKKAAQVAREAGRHRGTVSRTVGRGRTKIAKEAKALYEVLQAQQGPGPLVVDLADGRVLEAVLSLLTPRQQLYLYLYYGEWLSLREIGRLLRVDHASVLRSIRCGLERLGTLAVGTRAEVRGLEELEERLMAHFNQLEPPEEALRPRPKAPVRAPNPRRPPAERPPLRAMVLRLVRGGETRTAELGEGLRRTEGGRWGSGKLLAALEGWVERLPGRGREKEGRRQKLGRLLLKLFEWIRRELYADHHRN